MRRNNSKVNFLQEANNRTIRLLLTDWLNSCGLSAMRLQMQQRRIANYRGPFARLRRKRLVSNPA
jgi:hypothetical protein